MCESDYDCEQCIQCLKIGIIYICALHKVEIVPKFGAHCYYFDLRVEDDDISWDNPE